MDDRILGLDIGDVRIGIAVSDSMGWTAQGVESYARKGANDAAYIIETAHRLNAKKLVLGLPRNMNGTYGPACDKVRAFAAELEALFDGGIEFFDERLTTAAAQRVLIDADVSRKKRRGVVDKLAAVIILQNYLDSRG